jgi:hypothetical protein
MTARPLKEAVPPFIPLIVGLFILACAGVHIYTGKMHMKGREDIYRSADPERFRSKLVIESVIAALLLALWLFEISN